MSYQHAVVWLDHLHAKVIDFTFTDEHVQMVNSESEHRQVHRKSGAPGSGKHADDRGFFDGVVAALGDARDVLVAGPGVAKQAFVKDLEHRHPEWARRVVGVETMDHPSVDDLLVAARRYFKRIDNLRGV
jgi:stalled ribosome rescue protein Dom34